MGNILKNQEVGLTEISPSLNQLLIGISWDAPEKTGSNPVDIDASVFLLAHDGKVRSDSDFVFYNNPETENGNVIHLGDCKTPEGTGDNERIQVVLGGLNFDVDRLVFTMSIHNARERQQGLDMIKSAFMRIIDIEKNVELIRLDLEDKDPKSDSVVFGEIYRDVAGWRFKALGENKVGGLYAIASSFSVNVAPN